MSEIQVNTSDLKNGSHSLKSASSELGNVHSTVNSVSANIGNAYDGQLKQSIERIIGGSVQNGSRLQNRSTDLGNELLSRAISFEAANEAGRSAVLGISTEYINIIQKSSALGYLSLLNKWRDNILSIWNIGGLIIVGKLLPIFISSKSATVKTESPENSQIGQKVYKPQSPLGEYRITAHFPEYNPVKKSDGTVIRTIHNGIDIQPKDYDKSKDSGKDFSILPLGPGKVFKIDTQYKKDSNGRFILDKDGKKIIDGYGHYIVIEHTLPDGTTIYSRYAHMKAPSTLKTGDVVDTDTQLGIMGTSGTSSGQHVHLEVYKEGAYPGYGFKNPDNKFNPQDPDSLTFLEKMKQEFYDPEPFVNGTTDIRFVKPDKN